jgi:hypothetical protein
VGRIIIRPRVIRAFIHLWSSERSCCGCAVTVEEVEFEVDGVRVRHGAFTSESVPLLWISRRMGSEGSTGLLSLSQYPYGGPGNEVEDSPHRRVTDGRSHWRAAPMGVQGRGPHSQSRCPTVTVDFEEDGVRVWKHGASTSESVPLLWTRQRG